MTNDKRAHRRSIEVDYELPSPPAKVWRALTEPDLLERWLMPNDISPIVGHHFTFKTAPAPGFDGVVRCVILEVTPQERIAYSWKGGQLDTIVTFQLTATPAGGTKLKLTQEGFGPADAYTYDMLDEGWRHKSVAALRKVIDSLA